MRPINLTAVRVARRNLRVSPYLPAAIGFWRGVRHLRQADLARAAGLSLSTIKWLERGRKRGPRADTLEDVCEALDIMLLELYSTATKLALQARAPG